jgi:hypothetical protein
MYFHYEKAASKEAAFLAIAVGHWLSVIGFRMFGIAVGL